MGYFETKYIVPQRKLAILADWLEARFGGSDPYGNGPVDTLYFDTPTSDLFKMSAEGRPVRKKVRLRSYDGRNFTFLQVKKKSGRVSEKYAQPVSIPIRDELSPGLFDVFRIPEDFAFPLPILPRTLVTYQRNRYRTRDLRITLDRGLSFTSRATEGPHLLRTAEVPFGVLEMKSDAPAGTLPELLHWGLKIGSISKFLLGESLLRGMAASGHFPNE